MATTGYKRLPKFQKHISTTCIFVGVALTVDKTNGHSNIDGDDNSNNNNNNNKNYNTNDSYNL